MHGTMEHGRTLVTAREAHGIFTPRTLRRALLYLLVVVVALVIVVPLLWMVSTAFKPTREWYSPNVIPNNPTLTNFRQLFSYPDAPVFRWFLNSVFVATVEGALTLLVCALAVVPIIFASRVANMWSAVLLIGLAAAAHQGFSANLFTLVSDTEHRLTFAASFLPLLYVATSLVYFLCALPIGRLADRVGRGRVFVAGYTLLLAVYTVLLLPGLGSAFGVFFLRQFFLGLPTEMEEAMLIDGASRWRILWSMVVPLSKGALATLFVLSLLASWNDYLWPLIVLTSPTILTLPVGIASFQSEYNSFPGLIMAGALIATIPVLAIFTALQRFIVQSVASAGLKG